MGQKQKRQNRPGGRRTSASGAGRSKTGNIIKFHRQFSSGGVVFKKEGKNIFWLLTKSSSSKIYPNAIWRLPKGWIDDFGFGIPGLMASGKIKADENSLQKAAIREVAEEGGVEAKIIKKIISIKYSYYLPQKGNILKFVTFYLMQWVNDLPQGFDGETSEIAWLSFEEAAKTISLSREKQVLKKAKELLVGEYGN